jgi:hypothetical protein
MTLAKIDRPMRKISGAKKERLIKNKDVSRRKLTSQSTSRL